MTDPTDAPFPAIFARLAEEDPDRLAVVGPDRAVTFLELYERSTRLAHCYEELGVDSGSMVTIALPNGVEFYEALCATWILGAIPQPVSPRLPAIERDAIVELADPALVVGVEPDTVDRPAVAAGFVPPPATRSDAYAPRVSPSWKAPTSGGSTGRPKLIVAAEPAVASSIRPAAELFRITEYGTMLIPAALYHNAPVLFSSVGLLQGNTVIVMARFDAEETLRLIEQHAVTWIYAVPTMMQRIWRLPAEVRTKYDVSSLVTLLHAAAPCPEWLKAAWIEWLGAKRIMELYGGTEGQAATVVTGEEWAAHPGTVGRPVIGEIKILDRDGNEVAPGTVGEVWMRRGADAPPTYRYVGAEARARDGWECLGDLGRLDEDGYLYLADRDADMILVGGANVYPAEVEAALDAHPAVLSSCVIGVPHEDLGRVPHAIVELSEHVDDGELLQHLRERIVTYKLPRSFERSTQSLRDDAGKVRRSALLAARVASAPGTAE